MQPVELSVVYDIAGGAGGERANPGARGHGGAGGRGSIVHMYNAKTGCSIEDMKAPDGKEGPVGEAAKSTGSKGLPGASGNPLKFNGAVFTGGSVPAYTFAELAQALSLSQLLMTQNASDQEFLNAKNDDDRTTVAGGYTWLININQPFTDSSAKIDPARVSKPEQQVRAGIHNSAVVSLMRLQQGLDYYGHSHNWTPVLNLNSLVGRTGELIQLGKVVEDQFNRYLDKGLADKERMKAFTVQRGMAKASRHYKNPQWDLVDAVERGDVKLDALAEGELPEEMKGMPLADQKRHLTQKSEQRARLKDRIQELGEARKRHVARVRVELGESEAATLDLALIASLREQAQKKDIQLGAREER
jgi:hypothetical protein